MPARHQGAPRAMAPVAHRCVARPGYHYGKKRVLSRPVRGVARSYRQLPRPTPIPLLPVGMFKQTGAHVLLTAGLADIETEIRSTGTSGVPSVARRDALTTTRASIGILGGYRDFFGISNGAPVVPVPVHGQEFPDGHGQGVQPDDRNVGRPSLSSCTNTRLPPRGRTWLICVAGRRDDAPHHRSAVHRHGLCGSSNWRPFRWPWTSR